MKSVFPVLSAKIAENGIKKNVIALHCGISDKTFRNKMCGKSSFTWDEASAIHKTFFPDIPIDDLFEKTVQS